MIRTLDELGIEHGRCRQYEGENGCARVTLEDGDRIFLGSNKGGIAKERPLQLDEEDLKYISGFPMSTPAITVISTAAGSGEVDRSLSFL